MTICCGKLFSDRLSANIMQGVKRNNGEGHASGVDDAICVLLSPDNANPAADLPGDRFSANVLSPEKE